ncbi:hypothetical protein DERP_015397 [Dermatophagoides pteronyssinus]|uniref:Uncharacterized protein n=1 Tax=Dermatophagoides pteronyssinus TaxID=6956 RepID=A0ABQ8JAR0_DERPT|nr:hypothetical protein DERP_015397 [Dermatophagoides pteronyssinus]
MINKKQYWFDKPGQFSSPFIRLILRNFFIDFDRRRFAIGVLLQNKLSVFMVEKMLHFKI